MVLGGKKICCASSAISYEQRKKTVITSTLWFKELMKNYANTWHQCVQISHKHLTVLQWIWIAEIQVVAITSNLCEYIDVVRQPLLLDHFHQIRFVVQQQPFDDVTLCNLKQWKGACTCAQCYSHLSVYSVADVLFLYVRNVVALAELTCKNSMIVRDVW